MSREKRAKFRGSIVEHSVVFFIFLADEQGDDKEDHSRRGCRAADRKIGGEVEISES